MKGFGSRVVPGAPLDLPLIVYFHTFNPSISHDHRGTLLAKYNQTTKTAPTPQSVTVPEFPRRVRQPRGVLGLFGQIFEKKELRPIVGRPQRPLWSATANCWPAHNPFWRYRSVPFRAGREARNLIAILVFSKYMKLALLAFLSTFNVNNLQTVANQINSDTNLNLSRICWIKNDATDIYFSYLFWILSNTRMPIMLTLCISKNLY